jgi:diguanylate cyclase (GGDEF)-like protein
MEGALPRVGILVVDDRRENLLALEAILEPLGQRVVRAGSGRAALDAIAHELFAVILLDVRMPGLDGFETVARLAEMFPEHRSPVIFVSAFDDVDVLARSYAAGAVDFIPKPVDPDVVRAKVAVFVRLRQHELALERARDELEAKVAARTSELVALNTTLQREIERRKAAERRLHDRAFRDGLTGIANRGQFLIHLGRAFARWRRSRSPFALLLLDLDRFKAINDTLGHLAGDQTLVGVATRITAAVRAVDLVARLAGDEFAVVLDDVSALDQARLLVKRIEDAFAEPLPVGGRMVAVKVSIGAVVMSDAYAHPEDLMSAADSAMYATKARRRRRSQPDLRDSVPPSSP